MPKVLMYDAGVITRTCVYTKALEKHKPMILWILFAI